MQPRRALNEARKYVEEKALLSFYTSKSAKYVQGHYLTMLCALINELGVASF